MNLNRGGFAPSQELLDFWRGLDGFGGKSTFILNTQCYITQKLLT